MKPLLTILIVHRVAARLSLATRRTEALRGLTLLSVLLLAGFVAGCAVEKTIKVYPGAEDIQRLERLSWSRLGAKETLSFSVKKKYPAQGLIDFYENQFNINGIVKSGINSDGWDHFEDHTGEIPVWRYQYLKTWESDKYGQVFFGLRYTVNDSSSLKRSPATDELRVVITRMRFDK